MTYDEDGSIISVSELDELKAYVRQNESAEIRQARTVREKLRALEVLVILNVLTVRDM